jgi:hypothetical protein
MVIEWHLVQEALDLIEEVESSMEKAFTAVGRSDITVDVTAVCSIIEKYGKIYENQLLHLVYRDMDSTKFDNVMSTAIRCGNVTKELIGDKILYRTVKLEPQQ